jgi:hypothetical protein
MSDELIIAFLIALVIIVLFYHSGCGCKKHRDKYGPPPGNNRALGLCEVGDRGVAEWDKTFQAGTASSIKGVVELSA